ncbi:hypothetical protein [uncultured Nostoc sp.]|uniref:hypothetical protein n=1 Tax=uncultured Nostoc sp. TaxID=340711 RepID=UPI0035CA359E
MEIISHKEYIERWLESLKQNEVYYNINGFDFLEKFESQWDSSNYRSANFRPNFRMDIIDELYYRSFGLKNEHFDFYTLVSKFYLSGCSTVSCPNVEGVEANYEEKGGYNYLFDLPNIKEIEHYYAGDRILTIIIDWNAEFF